MIVLELRQVEKAYSGRPVVKGVSFSLEPGDFLGLIGANGAGKSTTMRMIVGMLKPTGGSVVINGTDIATDPLLARQSIGYVPEYITLYDYLTCEEYLDFVGEIMGLTESQRGEEAEVLMVLLDLEAAKDRLIRTYSQGMRRKVAIAGAMMGRPPVLVLDEAMNGLDALTIARLKVYLKGLAEAGTAMVLSSHVLDVVERICNRIVMLKDGEVAAQLSSEELVRIRAEEGGLEAHFLTTLRA